MNSGTVVVHLRSQAGQPYGSVRRCCNHCGTALNADEPKWVEYESDYDRLPAGYARCIDRKLSGARGVE